MEIITDRIELHTNGNTDIIDSVHACGGIYLKEHTFLKLDALDLLQHALNFDLYCYPCYRGFLTCVTGKGAHEIGT